ncbi:hypothetical protein GGU10DRAFT_352547 [Lentinula aff. detonsa]|uniref:Uncharacterized protein n=1 Tax=Lentinula aff. detonsa TaxID=2804958 RepID=A0AA38KAG9_9AGAR|nr:hypothetical protein GGU10DRAFT_352547 [Lentinula aff. detonsa]
MSKKALVDIAFYLNVPSKDVRQDALCVHLQAHFDAHEELKKHLRYIGIFERMRKRKDPPSGSNPGPSSLIPGLFHSHRVRLRLHQDHHCIRCPCITHPSPLHPFLVDSVTIMRTGHTHCMEHLISNSHYSLNGMLHTEHIVVNTTINATYQ